VYKNEMANDNFGNTLTTMYGNKKLPQMGLGDFPLDTAYLLFSTRFASLTEITGTSITVAGKGKISEPSTAGTSKLNWRCFEYY
jgi:hypothetical protein